MIVAGPEQIARFAGLDTADAIRLVTGAATDGLGGATTTRPRRRTTFAPDGPTGADDPLLLYFTSGTTAKPKLVRHSHRSYPVGALSTMYWLGLQPGDVHCNVSSPGWAKHAWSSFFAPWNAGRDDPGDQPGAVQRRRRCWRSWSAPAPPRCARRRPCGG